MIDFPWEREAIQGQGTPDGLSLTDQKAYQALSSLYGRYRLGLIDKAAGSTEKGRILVMWERDKRVDDMSDRLCKWHERLMKEIEGAQSRYLKERTLENADRLSQALDTILEDVI